MAPPPALPTARLRLSYPLCACDFDPHDARRLVVGGGGGPGRTGVGNKISVIDASRSDELSLAGELELSKDEDNVASLAVAVAAEHGQGHGHRRHHKGGSSGKKKQAAAAAAAASASSLLVYAGVNSGVGDIQKGKNEHFRSFTIDVGTGTGAGEEPRIAETARQPLFAPSKEPDVYQRLLRVSPPFAGSRQVGAAATGFGKEPQIAVFDVAAGGSSPKPRGRLTLAREAMDLDVIQTGEGRWQLAYCDDYDLYLMDVVESGSGGDQQQQQSTPTVVYGMPQEETALGAAKSRPTFRSVRYLTPRFVVAAVNMPQSSGVLLQVLRLPGSAGGEAGEKARVASSVRLPSAVKRSVGMAARSLAPLATPSAKQADGQFVVAVADQTCALTLLTLDYQSVADVDLITNPRIVTTLKNVHAGPISSLAFSHFTPPSSSSSTQSSEPQNDEKNEKKSTTTTNEPKLKLKLASVSMVGNTCVVHTLPVREKKTNGDKPSYVLALKHRGPGLSEFQGLIAAAILALVLAVFVQSFLEIKGLSSPVLGARQVAPVSWHREFRINIPGSGSSSSSEFLANILPGGAKGTAEGERMVLVMMNPDDAAGGGVATDRVTVNVHDPERHRGAREWTELLPAERRVWKDALRRAGHWTEAMGETVLRGVLFGEMAGAVGDAVEGQAG